MCADRFLRYLPCTMETDVRAVIFDFGNVLSLPQDGRDAASMAALCGLSVEAFGREYAVQRLELDHGTVGSTAYWSGILLRGGMRPAEETIRTLLALDIKSWTHMNPRMLGWAEELRAEGIRTAILSNMPADCVAYLDREASWMVPFEVRVFSADVSMTKPGEGIYLHCLGRLGLRPEQALFLDDLPQNVDAARRIGMRAIRFETPGQAAEAAASLGLPVTRLR